MQILKKFLFLLSPNERKYSIILLFMILIMALIDMIGVASILPFITVLINPEIIERNIFLNFMYQKSNVFGVETSQQFLFALGILVFIILVISITFKALTSYLVLRFTQMLEFTISKRLVEGYLNQPYSWFLNRHSADLGKSILSEVGIIVGHGLTPLMELFSKSFVVIALITLLIFIDPKIAIVAGFTFLIAYSLIYKLTRSYLKRIGKERLTANNLRFTAVSEAFGSAKEVKVGGIEEPYIKRFANPAKIFAKHTATSQVLSQLPRFALEVIAFGGMLLVILYLMLKSGSFVNIIPIIALYTFAGYRLMPALQSIYGAVTQLRFVSPALDEMYKDIKSLKPTLIKNHISVLPLKDNINIKNIHYDYPNSSRNILKNVDFKISANTIVGIVGETGSGKTTTVDIILGLLEPKKGSLEVDGILINESNKRSWQRSIGYVPQHINLIDDTLSANIAFGIEANEINHDAVLNASKIANLHEFVINELSDKYQTTIGERGVRLSGGQRQRIGIARALYHNPKLLILDEATNALDNITEKAVMEKISSIKENLTIIMIAHRLSTVMQCDNIFLLEKGKLIKQGTFKELEKFSHLFSKFVNKR